MTIHRDTDATVMVGVLSGQTAHLVDAAAGVWEVSWLPGAWNTRQAHQAIQIAEAIATGPRLGDPVWLHIERLLTELGADPAALDNLIDPEPNTEEEATS